MTQTPLQENSSVTLNGSGDGTLRMVPWGGNEQWQPSLVSVSASSNNSEASAKVYIGPAAAQQYYVDGTLSGSTGDSTDAVSGYTVDTHGNALWVVWAGGDAGATATAVINGVDVTP